MDKVVLDFYKLKEEPFGVTPDPHFLFPSATHREALASLVYGVEARRGFIALIAPPGMGKTTLLCELLEQLRESARTVFLFQTQCAPADLVRYLLHDLGAKTRQRNLAEMHQELNQMLLREMRAGRRFVLVIDEAQNLSEAVLETARLLSNFETASAKLMQIVFAGQPPLAEKLDRPSLYQLRQRISILCRLEPFAPPEVFTYVDYRLRIAGHEGDPLFTPSALQLIAEHSKGIPRNINNLCFNALSLGFATGRAKIGPEIVEEVVKDLNLGSFVSDSPPAPSRSPVVDTTRAGLLHVVKAFFSGRSRLSRSVAVLLLCLLTLLALQGAIALGVLWAKRVSLGVSSATQSSQPRDTGFARHEQLASTSQSRVAEAVSAPDQEVQQILHVVQFNETLERISVIYCGAWNSLILGEIRKLNPSLVNPDRILVGQEILLPRTRSNDSPTAVDMPASLGDRDFRGRARE
jgi:type II secretory pathway predicted ATPase ExeA